MDVLINHEDQRTLLSFNESQKQYTDTHRIIIIIGFSTLVVALLIAILLTHSITTPLKVATNLILTREISHDTSAYKSGGGELGAMIRSFMNEITERKQAEKELIAAKKKAEENELKYRSLVETTSDIIWETNIEGVYTYISPQVETILGYQQEELIGNSPFKFMKPEEAKKIKKRSDEIIASKKPFNGMVNTNIHKNGTSIQFETSGTPIFDNSNNLIGYRGIDRDVTERILEENFLSLTNELLVVLYSDIDLKSMIDKTIELIQNHTQYSEVGMRLKSGDDYPYYSHSGFTDKFLQKENSLIAKDKKNNICKDKNGNPKLECTCGLVISSKIDHNNPYLTKDGSFWTNDSFPLLDLTAEQDPQFNPRNTCIHFGYGSVAIIPIRANGIVVGTLQLNEKNKNAFTKEGISFFENICLSIGTAFMRKQVDEELKIERQRLSSILKGTNVGTWEWNIQTGETIFNERWAEIIGYKIEEISPISIETWMKYTHPDDLVASDDLLKKHFKGELAYYEFEARMKHKNGSWVWVSDKGKVYEWDKEGNALLMSGTHQDITERKQSEKAIIESHRLNAIGEMASSVAHDFNNSLQAMAGNIELVKLKGNLPEAALGNLNKVSTIINDVAGRIKSLQRFGDNKRESSDYKLIDLNAIISESIIQTQPLWKDNKEKDGKTIHIKANYGDITEIYCNEGELKSVFLNLIKNSTEAMPNGGNITIETGTKNNNVFTTISDTGTGMNEETKIKIFQPFYTTKGFDAGRGLGMSGVYSILKAFGGEIFVKSTALGMGTTIEMVLPIPEQLEVKDEIVKASPVVTDQVELRILWVEDDFAIRDSMAMMVDLMGHQCDTAKSGKVALEFIEKNIYDLIITDIGMKEMNGWQLADIIKEKFEGKMKVAVCSGWEVEDDEKLAHGVKYVLGKPFSTEKLKDLFLEVQNSLVNTL